MSTAAAHADSVALQQEIVLLRGENKTLRDQLAWFKQKVFGPGRSETLDRAQQLIALDAATAPAPERPVETISYQREKGPRAARPTPGSRIAVRRRLDWRCACPTARCCVVVMSNNWRHWCGL